MDDETFQALRHADWGEIGKSLLAVAINYSLKYPSIGINACDDIVQDVIEKTLRGEPVQDTTSGEVLPWRTWDPKKGELLPWLKWCVKSEIDNSAKLSATKNELLLIDNDDKDVERWLDRQNITDEVIEGSTNPEIVLLQHEKEAYLKQEIAEIYSNVEDNEPLEDLVLAMDCYINEDKTTSVPTRPELAENLGTTVNDIDNRMKRLRRRLLKARNKG